MKHTRSAVVGVTAVLAAGLVGAATPASASTRITSSQQLKASIAQAVALEKQSGAGISCCLQGLVLDSANTPAF